MIVVDLGCAEHGDDLSIKPLIERFHPDVLYGFDPWPGVIDMDTHVNGTRVVLERKAAWTEDGFVGFVEAGIRSHVHEFAAGVVPCFDLAKFITALPADDLVVKMDVEGAEYQLCQHLIDTGADERISLLLIEWHDDGRVVGLSCPVEEWDHRTVAA